MIINVVFTHDKHRLVCLQWTQQQQKTKRIVASVEQKIYTLAILHLTLAADPADDDELLKREHARVRIYFARRKMKKQKNLKENYR